MLLELRLWREEYQSSSEVGVTSFKIQYSTVSLHSLLEFCTGNMGLIKDEQVLLITPWLSSQSISLWMGIREPRLV